MLIGSPSRTLTFIASAFEILEKGAVSRVKPVVMPLVNTLALAVNTRGHSRKPSVFCTEVGKCVA